MKNLENRSGKVFSSMKHMAHPRGKSLSARQIAMFIAVGGAVLMLCSPASALASSRKAVDLWIFTVLPSMLPFFVCTDLLISSGMHVRLGSLFERPLRKWYGVPGVAGFVFVSSILSGYPTGAKVLGDLHGKHQITGADVRNILTFCSTSGPLFILGAVGSGMLRSEAAGYVILAAHYAGALLTGLIAARSSVLHRMGRNKVRRMPENGGMPQIRYTYSGGGKSVSEMVTEAVLSSFRSLVIIGGYIILFMILTDAVKRMVELLAGTNGFSSDVVAGLFEMTVGCSGAANSAVPIEWKMIACTFFVSFGGLSVAAQSMSVMKNCGVRLSFYLRFKLLHGLISSLCTCTIIKILSFCSTRTVSVFEPTDLAVSKISDFAAGGGGMTSLYSFVFSSAAAVAMMIAFYLAVILFSGRGRKDESDGNHSGI